MSDRGGVPDEMRDLLADVYEHEGVELYWVSRNRMLDGQRPCDLWETDPDRVRSVIGYLTGGAW